MPKPSCKSYSDVVSVLSNQDRRESEFLGLDLTKPSITWFDKIALRLGKTFRSKDSPLNENDIRKAIKKEYGKIDERKVLATKFMALLEVHPALEEMMDDFLSQQVTAMEGKGEVKFGEHPLTRERTLDIASLPIAVIRNATNELQSVIRQGYGEKVGKGFLKGILGPIDLQLTTPRKMTRKESTGAIFNMRKEIRDFPLKQANQMAKFSGPDHEKKQFVKLKGEQQKVRNYGMENVLNAIDALSTDPSLSKLNLPNSRRILQDMFAWYNVRDDMYNKEDDEKGNRRLKIAEDGTMTIATKYKAAYDDKGNLIQWDNPDEGLQSRSAKFQFTDYVPVEDYYKDLTVPITPAMLRKFKHQADRYEQLHKNVWNYLSTEFGKSEKELYNELKSLVPKDWSDEDVTALFFKEDPRDFTKKRYDSEGNLSEVISWADLNEEQQKLIALIHKHATRYNVLKPFIFNARNEQESPSEGRISFPIIYNQMKFSFLWDDMIEDYDSELKDIELELKNPNLINPQTSADKQLKFKLKQKKKILLSTIKRSKWIRDRKDDYPIDLATGTYLALGDDSKHVKHISNQFNILEGRTDPGTYFAYLRHNIAQLERNRLSLSLIQNLKRARSEPVQNYILNLYKVALYQPDAASGFSWLKLDSDSVSRTFGKVGIQISAAKIDRKARQVLSYISGNLLRGWGTATQNYTAVVQKYIDVGMERVIEAYDIMEKGGKDLERIIGLSGVVDFREFFSKSLTDDAVNLGGENKDIMKMTNVMIKYWQDAEGKTEKQKRILQERMEKQLGRAINSIVEPERLKKRRKIQRDIHRTNMLRKWVNYAINKEYEAAPYVKNKFMKAGMSLVETWAAFQKTHAPTMGKTEQSLRALSFIIGVRAAMRKGYIPDKNIAELSPEELKDAIAIGVDYVEQMDFGLSRQDLGEIGHSNIGAFFTQFKVWSMQKFSKDLDTVRLAYQELRNVDNKHFDFKAGAQMFESLVRLSKYSHKHLRTTNPKLAAFRTWIYTQGLWTALWDFGIMGPLALIPGVNKITRSIPGIRTIGGSTSDLISLMLLVPGLAIASSFGDGEDEWEKILDYYTRKTFFGFGARWSMDFILTMLATIEGEDDEDYKNRLNKTILPALPPPLKDVQASRILIHQILD